VDAVRSRSAPANWDPLRALLADVDDRLTISWTELDALVGGLPPSAYRHSAYWTGDRSGWPGFTTTDVRVGESVTFVRRDSARPQEAVADRPSTAAPRSPEAPSLFLLGCVKSKQSVAAPAKDLYTSPLFRKGRAYIEAVGSPWFILSAHHGLVHPDEIIEPYDLALSALPRSARVRWGEQVMQQLRTAYPDLRALRIEVHASEVYLAPIRRPLESAGATVVAPLAGLTMGERLAWYGRYSDRPRSVQSSSQVSPGVANLVAALTTFDASVAPDELLVSDRSRLAGPGLYSWWTDADGAADLSRGLGYPIAPGLIYAGLAGATRTRSGRASKNSLWARLTKMHLGDRHEFSTLRKTLGAILQAAWGVGEFDETRLTSWMREHLRVVAVPVPDPDLLDAMETEVLRQLDPPLNLQKLPRTPLRQRISALRSELTK